jgi:hypothetical protein
VQRGKRRRRVREAGALEHAERVETAVGGFAAQREVAERLGERGIGALDEEALGGFAAPGIR